jgi:hypothetical protein
MTNDDGQEKVGKLCEYQRARLQMQMSTKLQTTKHSTEGTFQCLSVVFFGDQKGFRVTDVYVIVQAPLRELCLTNLPSPIEIDKRE